MEIINIYMNDNINQVDNYLSYICIFVLIRPYFCPDNVFTIFIFIYLLSLLSLKTASVVFTLNICVSLIITSTVEWPWPQSYLAPDLWPTTTFHGRVNYKLLATVPPPNKSPSQVLFRGEAPDKQCQMPSLSAPPKIWWCQWGMLPNLSLQKGNFSISPPSLLFQCARECRLLRGKDEFSQGPDSEFSHSGYYKKEQIFLLERTKRIMFHFPATSFVWLLGL